MKKLFTILVLSALLSSCDSSPKHNMFVNGSVQGLKKGTLYLQKVEDSIFVSVDSLEVAGNGNFKMSTYLEDAEMYFLNLDNNPNFNLAFFGEPGNITVNTNLEDFALDAKVAGSKNQALLEDYNKMAKRFNNARLDIVKAGFEAQQSQDAKKIDSLNKASENLIIRRYYYTTNFAVNNGDYEVAPYLGLTELYNATNKLLDTIETSMSPEVGNSKYGRALKTLIESRK